MNWGTREECQCPRTVGGGKNFLPRWYTKKVLDTLSNFALKNSLYSVSTWIAFQSSQGLIQMNWGSRGSREECNCPSKVWGGKNFWPRWYTKKLLDTLSNFALKTRYLMFQHKSLFKLVKDLLKWIEGLWRSVNVRVQFEGERIFELGGIRKKYLIRCQISRSKTRYIVFQHKSLFKLVKDLFKWIGGLERSVNVRVQFEGERTFYLGGIRKKYLIRCQNSRSKTRYIVFQHESLFNLVKDLFKWIEGLGGLGRSVTVRVKSEGKDFLT